MFHSDQIRLFRGLSDSVKAGIPPAGALRGLCTEGGGGDALEGLARGLDAGHPFSVLMRERPEAFPAWQTEIVAAAEAAGRLDKAFDALASSLEESRAFWLALVPKLIYPLILVHFAPVALNISTLILRGPLPFLGEVLGPLLPLYLAAGALAYAAKQPGSGVWLRRLPLASGWLKSRFCSFLSLLIRAGISPSRALELAAMAAGMPEDEARLRAAVRKAETGEPFLESLRVLELFRGGELDSLRAGETAGKLDEQLSLLARMSDQRNQAVLQAALAAVPPVIFIFVGLAIAWGILGFYGNLSSGLGSAGF